MTFSTWRLGLDFIPAYYLLSSVSKSTRLLLLWSPEFYVHLQFYITDKPITLSTWLLLVPSSKQVVDWEASKTILLSSMNHPDNVEVERILLSRPYSFCWGETTLLFLISQVDTSSGRILGQFNLPVNFRLLGRYSSIRRKSKSHHDSVVDQRILLSGSPGVVYLSMLICERRYSLVDTIFRMQRTEQLPCYVWWWSIYTSWVKL